MVERNRIKTYCDNSTYHIYNRGVNKEEIFRDLQDYAVFMGMLKRLLGDTIEKNSKGKDCLNLNGRVELNAFCLMPNHFHMMVYQVEKSDIETFMRSLCTSYSKYFNKKHNRVGHMFQGTYKARLVETENDFKYLSKYIHLNPSNWEKWQFSSIHNYLGKRTNDWVKPLRVLETFENISSYLNFLDDDTYPIEFAKECTRQESPG